MAKRKNFEVYFGEHDDTAEIRLTDREPNGEDIFATFQQAKQTLSAFCKDCIKSYQRDLEYVERLEEREVK